MAINLTKGQTISLDKSENDLSKLVLGLGWKIKSKGGFFSKLLSGSQEYDLDAIAILLDEHSKIRNFGDRLVGGDVVFFNSLRHPSGAVVHSGDNLVGGAGVEDNEQITVRLDMMPSYVRKILLAVCIYQGSKRNQHFGEIDKAFIRAVDGKGKELARYDLSSDTSYQQMRTIVFGELYLHNNGWKFRALGSAQQDDSLLTLITPYLPAE